jgi:O-antigen/teichoic acid export membrane protein
VGICAWIILQHTKWLGDPVAQNLLKLLLLLLPIMIFNQVFQSALIGERRIKSVAAVQILIALLSIGAVVPMAWIWGLSGWLYNQYLVIVFSFFILVFLLRRIISFRWNGSTAKKVARIGGFAFAAQLLGTLIYQVDTLTVSGILKDPFSTGIYNTAALIAQQMIVFPGAILQATFPFVAHNRNDLKKLKARYQELLIKLALLGAIMAGVAWLICPFLFVLFGDKFYASISPFRVLIIGSVFQGLVILNNTYLDALGRTDIHFYTGIFSAVTAVSLNLAFIPHWQLMGAAWATTVTLFFSFLLRHVSVQYFIFHKKAIR